MIGSGRTTPVEETTSFALAKACRAHRVSVGAELARLGLHVGQEMVLLELWREDGLKGGELAARLRVEPPTVTRMLQRLEACGLVKRSRDPEDARSLRVYLTPAGRNLQDPVAETWARIEEETFQGMSEKEKQLFRSYLARVRQNLGVA